jgi:hypothetical protein
MSDTPSRRFPIDDCRVADRVAACCRCACIVSLRATSPRAGFPVCGMAYPSGARDGVFLHRTGSVERATVVASCRAGGAESRMVTRLGR